MGAIERYIVRTTMGAFALILGSLTAVIWATYALRDFDLVTNQGQTLLVFIGITVMLIPGLALVIAPVAFMIALVYTLNKLNTDSEIIVMSASGMSPWRVYRPFLIASLMVAGIVAALSVYIAPKSQREVRTLITSVRADLIANIIQPGRFTTLEGGLTFHISERRPNGELSGILIDDRRDPSEKSTFLAERGQLLESGDGTFLVLEQGSVQRHEAKQRDPTIVQFERYAFDITRFAGAGASPTFNASERYLWDLAAPDPNDPYVKNNAGRIRAEFNDRLLAPVYPIVFGVLAFAVLGAPRTTRQSRGMAILLAVGLILALRLVGFAGVVFSNREPSALWILYGNIAFAFGLGVLLIWRGASARAPSALGNAMAALQARFARPAVQS
jgi:lipopolysaccharide export system permease protein